MKFSNSISCLLLLVVSLFMSGCGEEKYTGPESVNPDQVNTVMNESFADASEDLKKVVQDLLVSYSKSEFTKASAIMQALPYSHGHYRFAKADGQSMFDDCQ